MGGLHARVCSENTDVALEAVVDSDSERARRLAQQYGATPLASAEELPGTIDAAVVAVPTAAHAKIAVPLLEKGIGCLVEKPLAAGREDAAALVRAADTGGAPLQVGHTERFNPAFMALGRYDLKPRFIETVRVSPCRFRSMDVGVVMDMMIHDIDLVLSLIRSDVESVDAVGVSVVGLTEDMANVRVRFANGCVADMVASRAALKVERRIRIFSESAYVGLDFGKKSGVVIRPGESLKALREAAMASGRFEPPAAENADFESMLDVEQIEIDDHDALTKQLAAFVEALRGEGDVVVSGEDGRRAVDLACRIVEMVQARTPSSALPEKS